MSSLSSSSTTVQVKAAYDDNASYLEDGDVSKAKTFLTACMILKRRVPLRSTHAGADMTKESLNQDIEDVKDWLAQNDVTPGPNPSAAVKFADFRDFR
jgi:hypothetical protein